MLTSGGGATGRAKEYASGAKDHEDLDPDLFGSQIQGDLIGVAQWRFYQGVASGEGVRVGGVRQLSLAAFSFPSPADAEPPRVIPAV